MGNTDPEKDIIKSDPIEALNRASTISLSGGGVLLFVALGLINQINVGKWQVDRGLMYILVIGAIVMAILSVALKVVDVVIRYKLAKALIAVKGTADAEAAKNLPSINQETIEAVKWLMKNDSTRFIIEPGTLQQGDTTQNPSS